MSKRQRVELEVKWVPERFGVALYTEFEGETYWALFCNPAGGYITHWSDYCLDCGDFPWPLAKRLMRPGALHVPPDPLLRLKEALRDCVASTSRNAHADRPGPPR
jgi:hypothetical protein